MAKVNSLPRGWGGFRLFSGLGSQRIGILDNGLKLFGIKVFAHWRPPRLRGAMHDLLGRAQVPAWHLRQQRPKTAVAKIPTNSRTIIFFIIFFLSVRFDGMMFEKLSPDLV